MKNKDPNAQYKLTPEQIENLKIFVRNSRYQYFDSPTFMKLVELSNCLMDEIETLKKEK